MPLLLLLGGGADVSYFAGIDFAGTGNYARLSNQLRAFTVRRGRSTQLDRVEAGTAQVQFVNGSAQAGALDPANVNSPYYPNILPLKSLRLYRKSKGVSYRRFTGPIERYNPEWLPPLEAYMNVEAADGFETLASQTIVSSQSTLTTALAGANNDLVFTAVDAGEQGDSITVTYVVAGLNTALTTATNNPTTTIGNVRVTSVQARRRSVFGLFGGSDADEQTTSGGGSVSTPTVTSPVTISGTDITVNVATNGAGAATSTASQVLAAIQASTEASALVTVALAPANTGAGVVTAMAKTALSGGKWAQELSGARISRVLDLVGWPAASRSIDTGQFQTIAKGFSARDNVSALAHIQDVAASELGYVFMDGTGNIVFHDGAHRTTSARSTTSQETFSDDGVGYAYRGQPGISFDKDKIINQAIVTSGAQGAIPQTVNDTGSQASFGVRSVSRTTLLTSDADAATVAQAVVDASASPVDASGNAIPRFETVTLLEDLANANWSTAMLALEIGDRVTIRTNPPSTNTTIAYDCFVEEIQDARSFEHTMWQVQLRVSPVGTASSAGGGGGGGALHDSVGANMVLDSGALG